MGESMEYIVVAFILEICTKCIRVSKVDFAHPLFDQGYARKLSFMALDDRLKIFLNQSRIQP